MFAQRSARGRTRSRVVLAAACLGILAVGPAVPDTYAQATTGGIRGIVRDETAGVLAGVTVEASSPALIGGPAVEVTNSHGLYSFTSLPIGMYAVTFTLQGFATVTRQDIRVEGGRTIELPQQMSLSTVAETITVAGETPVVDTLNAGTTTVFNQQLIDNIPTTRNSFFGFVQASPAVKTDSSPGSVRFVVYGSSYDQNSYQMDGVESGPPSYGSVWDFPGYDIISEVQVKAIGASAEYAGFQGAAINIVTRSGSNTLKGMGSVYFDHDALLANNTPNEQFPAHIDYSHQGSAMLGGPVKRDRLWYQLVAQGSRSKSTGVGVDPRFAFASKGWKPFFKITSRLSDRDTLDYSQNDNRFSCCAAPTRTSPQEARTLEHGFNPVIATRWTRVFSGTTLLEAKGGGIYIRDRFDPWTRDLSTPGRSDLGTGFDSVNGTSVSRSYQNRTTINVNLAHTANDFIVGTQDFKFGVQFGHQLAISNSGIPGGVSYTDFFGAPYEATRQDPRTRAGRIRDIGAFIQDNWTLTDRVTLNLGVRFDRIRAGVPEADELGNDAKTPTGRTVPGLPNLITFDHVSPRVGMTYKLDSVGKTVAKVSYGRYYGKLVTNMFQEISPGNTTSFVYGYNAAARRYDILKRSTNPNINYGIDPDLENQYTDQFFVGFEREILPDFGIDLSFVAKNQKRFLRMRDARGVYVPQAITDTFGGRTQTLTVYNLVTPIQDSLFQVTNRDDLDDDFKSVVAQAYKRFSRGWQMHSSYTWQRGKGYYPGTFGVGAQDFNSLGPGAFGRDPNDLINAFGRMPTDTTHAVRLLTTYEAPWEIHLGLRYTYEASRPVARLITVRGLRQGARTVIAEPRGSYTIEPVNDFQIRLDKDLRLGGSRRLRLSVDIYNLFNANTILSARNNSSQTGDALFLQSLSVVPARQARLGFRFEF